MSTDTAVRQAITVAAQPDEAFSTFTAGINRWWPRDHHIGSAELDEAIIEGHEGGAGTSATSTAASASGGR